MLHLNFYSFAEKKPNQGETIVYLKRENPFGLEAFTPHEATVNIEWAEFINGDYTGRAIKYDPANPVAPESTIDEVSNESITYRLMIIVDGYEVNDNWFWMPLNDYLDVFDESAPIDMGSPEKNERMRIDANYNISISPSKE